jgi:hypothetical protein
MAEAGYFKGTHPDRRDDPYSTRFANRTGELRGIVRTHSCLDNGKFCLKDVVEFGSDHYSRFQDQKSR